MKVLSVFGTRPEAIKMSPVIQALAALNGRVESRVCVTAQHRGMLDQMLAQFSITPDHDLNLMTIGQSPSQVAARVMRGMEEVLARERPDWVLVQGDTTTTMAAALAANYAGAQVGHVEAGLRTFNRRQPFPEEINRQLVSTVADLDFAPTPTAAENLIAEGVDRSRILVTGNTGIDALYQTIASLDPSEDGHPWSKVPEACRVILVTAHRRENLGHPLEQIYGALGTIAERYRDDVVIVYPVHPRREVWTTARRLLGNVPNIMLLGPIDYRKLVQLMLRCDFLITDSGGLQEEAPTLGKPVLVLREVTERPEAVSVGSARLVGTERERILRETMRLLDDLETYTRRARPVHPYGDGRAADRIVRALLGEAVVSWQPHEDTPVRRSAGQWS